MVKSSKRSAFSPSLLPFLLGASLCQVSAVCPVPDAGECRNETPGPRPPGLPVPWSGRCRADSGHGTAPWFLRAGEIPQEISRNTSQSIKETAEELKLELKLCESPLSVGKGSCAGLTPGLSSSGDGELLGFQPRSSSDWRTLDKPLNHEKPSCLPCNRGC